ncbi:MAG TPA: rod shape-determining protein MreC [Bacteroidales bacterium]|nr:rod shape-determining protein MreC [Bacteroidales bacterium]
MNNLLKFLIKFRATFLFIALEVIALMLLFTKQSYQSSAFFSSANIVVAQLYSMSNSVVEFFKMKSDNAALAEENTLLTNKINELENTIVMLKEQNMGVTPVFVPAENDLHYISAKVINITTNRQKNYLTINKGSRDGIMPGMGVISAEGAVGVVKNVSEKFAVIIPILNPELQLNCRFKATDYAGPLVWDGADYRFANLEDIARHVELNNGDTLVTSGLTSTFPQGILVGVVENNTLNESDAYYHIKVRLAVNFRTLTYVRVISNANSAEQHQLEQQ